MDTSNAETRERRRFGRSPWIELKQAWRGLRRQPALVVVSVLTLGLGIGANTAIFSVVNAALLRSLPFPNADSLVQVFGRHPGADGKVGDYPSSSLELVRWREQSRLIERIEAVQSKSLALTGSGEAEPIEGASVSAGFFDLLGARPVLGRVFTQAEDRVGAEVAVVGHELWRTRLGERSDIVGSTLTIDGRPRVVVGVLQPRFSTLIDRSQIWIPLGYHSGNHPNPQNRDLVVLGRLRPGVETKQASAELEAISRRLEKEAPVTKTGWSAAARPLRQALFGDRRPALLMLLGAVGCLLAIACANVTNLLLARILGRRAATAVRIALGASRRDLMRQAFAEGALLAGLGAACGLVLAQAILRALVYLDPTSFAGLPPVRLDHNVLLFTLGLTSAIAMAVTLLPSLSDAEAGLAAAIGSGSRRTAGSRVGRLREALVVGEVALSLVLLVGAFVMIKSLGRLRRIEPGFDARNLLTFQLTLPAARYPGTAERAAFVRAVLDRLRALPGVAGAATTLSQFTAGQSRQTGFEVEGRPSTPGEAEVAHFRRVSPDYFRTMRIEILEGRPIEDGDRAGATPVAVVSTSFAKRYWPGRSALGARIKRTTHDWVTVVGVAADVRDAGLGDSLGPALYLPQAQNNVAAVTVVIRTARDPLRSLPDIRGALHSIDPNLPIQAAATAEDLLTDSLAPQRYRATLLGAFGAVGLLLAALGVYGTASYSVAQRTREIGIRIALGARTGDVLRLALERSMASVGVGLALGLGLMFAIARPMATLLYEVPASDPVSVAVVLGTLVLAGFLATLVPALRAVRVDPVIALQTE